MQLFYSPDIKVGINCKVDGKEHIHLTKSLRKKIGDTIHITNGKGSLFLANISTTTKKYTELNIIEEVESKPQLSHLSLAVAPTKLLNRYEWFIEKAVELGAIHFMPFTSFHSERRNLKSERLNLIALGAMKQSIQYHLPKVDELASFKEVIALTKDCDVKLIAFCEEHGNDIGRHVEADKETIVLIGPEGGFSKEEVGLAKDAGFIPISLGKNRLRTETAGIFVASMFFTQL